MEKWTKAELQAVIQEFIHISEETWGAGDIDQWASWYTEDVIFRDLGVGYGNDIVELHGREAVREWYTKLRNTYPSCHAIHYPSPWQVIDEERGWIVMEWRTRMRDPGDGSIHEEKNYSQLKYAGNKQFSYEEDIYNPQRHLTMVQRWMDIYERYHPKGCI